jgi:tetratricopeptide (TPR) repeat protein/transcriptional regulator with XRE-family HTH domain
MTVKVSPSSKEQVAFSPVQLSALAGYQKFGDYLRIKRKQFGLLQREMAECFSLTASMYGFLERERRAPQVEELVPMFTALVELQSDKHLPPMQVIEAETFFRLGKAIIEKKGRKRPNITQQEWGKIEQQLMSLVDRHQRNQVHLVPGENSASSNVLVLEPSDSRRRRALRDMLKTDLSHLLEREAWVRRVLAYPDRIPQIKVSVIQAGVGAGKSHALALLIQHLVKRDDLFLISYQFKHSETMTPEDHLDEFLATLSTDLTMRVTDGMKQRPLVERIDQILAAIRTYDQKVVLLLDDAQEMFPSASEWSAAWHQFFEAFIGEPHSATLYMMTRVWVGWDDRKRSFLEEEDLPDLSVEAGIQLWQRQGFNDVDSDLLRQVCERCGQNPQAIEMLAFQYKRRGFSINWKGFSYSTYENPHTASLKKLLQSDTLFSGNLDETSRRTLQQVFSSRLSGEDLRLLECLALSPLGIPFDLVVDQFDYAAQSYEKLVKASFADLSMAATGRAAIVPLVREAVLQSLTIQRKYEVEQLITTIYAYWLQDVQDFKDDGEKAALIAEMIVRSIRQRQLLKAAELFISFGWLCTLFGHIMRIRRVYEEVVKENRGKEEDRQYEVGRLILQHRMAVYMGQKIDRDERDQIYQSIYKKIVAGEVTLQPHSELEVLHNMRLLYTRNSQYAEANQMFGKALERLSQSGRTSPEVLASFLYSRAQLFFGWSEEQRIETPEALRNMQIARDILEQSIEHWQVCLKNTLPLQEHYINFRLARSLNDYAYVLRFLGMLPEAQKAIQESIRLKKLSRVLPHSLAISLSEKSQIMALQGEIRQALVVNEEAVQILEQALENGDATHNPELGMFLVERANILKQQARLMEAKPLLERAIELIGNKPSRRQDKNRAIGQLEEVRLTHQYRLDWRWFSRYQDLVSYDDLAMLAQAGPFNDAEQIEWEELSSQEGSMKRLLELIAQSRERERLRSQQESCVPTLWYPCIQLDNVQGRQRDLVSLRGEIEVQEGNAIVRRLYLNAIDEHLTILRLIEAIALQDQNLVRDYNVQLYGKPTQHEFKIALQSFYTMLLEARDHKQAGPVVQDILTQLKSWSISPCDFMIREECFTPKRGSVQQRGCKVLAGEKKQFPATVVRKFFQNVLSTYGAQDWEVSISPARDYTYVDPNVRVLVLPQKSFTVSKIRQLLAEEIETHVFRALAGQHSPLALLGLGLAGQEATEEGLAYSYVRRVNQQVGGNEQEKMWIGTLALGLASGILTSVPALSFQELRCFLEKMYFVKNLLGKEDKSQDDVLAGARQLAWVRSCRTFRGVPNLAQSGCCSLKDKIYLSGHLEVSRYLECGGDEQRLYVGAIGIEHLEDMAELHILLPNYPHRYFALDLDLIDHLTQCNEDD